MKSGIFMQVYPELFDHPKTKCLQREIKKDLPTAIGGLIMFLFWVESYYEDGFLPLDHFYPEDITEYFAYSEDPAQLINALISSGIIEAVDGGYQVCPYSCLDISSEE